MSHSCLICGRIFKRETAFSKHQLLCQLRSGPKDDSTMSVSELTIVVRHLLEKQAEMQTRIDALRNQIVSRKQFSVPKLLAMSQKPDKCVEQWLQDIKFSRKALEAIFEAAYIDGIKICIEEASIKDGHHPVAYVSRGTNKLYLFANDEWVLADTARMLDITRCIVRKSIAEFSSWQTGLGNNIYDDAISRQYHRNVQKIMSASMKIDSLAPKVKSLLGRSFEVMLGE